MPIRLLNNKSIRTAALRHRTSIHFLLQIYHILVHEFMRRFFSNQATQRQLFNNRIGMEGPLREGSAADRKPPEALLIHSALIIENDKIKFKSNNYPIIPMLNH